MLPHQQRVIDEKKELDEKHEKLTNFTFTDMFSSLPREEQTRLNRQHAVMETYSQILGERIAAFKE